MEDIQELWDQTKRTKEENSKFSVQEIAIFRKKYSSGASLATQRLINFDTVLKLIIVMAYSALLFLGGLSLLKVSLSLISIGLLAFLAAKNFTLKSQLNTLNESLDIISVLKSKYDFLSRFYREFLLITSITNPFLVLAGFQIYLYLKTGEDRLQLLLADPVTYVFLGLAFIIPFVAYRITFNKELKSLEEIIDIDINEVNDEIRLINVKRKKKFRQIIFVILALTGLLALLIILSH